MKKLLFVALSFLFASSAFGQWGMIPSDAKGSMTVKVVNDGNTNTYSFALTDSVANGVALTTTGTTGTKSCVDTGSGYQYCTIVVTAGEATTVTVRTSGKLSDCGTATGSGSVLFTYTGTGTSVSLQSKKEYGLASAGSGGCAIIEETKICASSEPTRTWGIYMLWNGTDNCA